jgi:hypothetical protein
MPPTTVPIYLELGHKRVFAGALAWPGWCVSGRDEAAALQALFEAGPRYAQVLKGTRLGFKSPADPAALKVVERLKGNSTTDFGAPDVAPQSDSQAVDAADLKRLTMILKAAWRALDAASESAHGKALRKGPRGGGRGLAAILAHVAGAEAGYLSALGWKHKVDEKASLANRQARTRAAVLEGLAASARGEIPAVGPRGGQRWSARYFVRRAAWHVLDHVWEIENRLEQ